MHRPRSTLKRKRLRAEAEAEAEEWSRRRRTHVDNAERILLTPPVLRSGPLVGVQPRNGVPMNASRRLDLMRQGTHTSLMARSLRSQSQPLHDRLYWQNSYDATRDVYRCLNCGKMARPEGLRDWYAVKGQNLDELAYTMPLLDRWVDTDQRVKSFALAPRITEPLLPGERYQQQTSQRMIPNPFGMNVAEDERILFPFFRSTGPVIFVCSKQCYEEQQHTNYIRDYKYHHVKQGVRDSGLFQDVNDDEQPGEWTQRFRRVQELLPDTRIPDMTEEEFATSTQFYDFDTGFGLLDVSPAQELLQTGLPSPF